MNRDRKADDAKTAEKNDAKGQHVRRRFGDLPANRNGLHSANPVVFSGTGDATQPVKSRQPRIKKH